MCSAEKRIWFTKGEEREEAKKDFIESFKILEGELSDKPYFGAKHLGLWTLLRSLSTIGSIPLRCLGNSA